MVEHAKPEISHKIFLVLGIQIVLVLGTVLVEWWDLHSLVSQWGSLVVALGTGATLLLGMLFTLMVWIGWRKQPDQERQQNHDQFRHLVDSIDGIVWESDPVTLENTFVSRRAERLLGYPVEDWYADPEFWHKHLHPDDLDKAVKCFAQAEADLQPFTADYRMVKSDGSVVWIRDIVTITAVDGRASMLHGVMVDITERKRVEEELTRYKDRLEELVAERSEALVKANMELTVARERAEEGSRLKSSFLANMSHELRTPLNAIILYSDLIMEEVCAEGKTGTMEDLTKIQNSGRHLVRLIDDILDLSKIEAGRIVLNVEETNIPGLIQEITAHISPMLNRNHNRMMVEMDPKITIMETDQTRLRQILINLLSNAAKFTSGGDITLGIQPDSDPNSLLFFVRDTGIGMTLEQQSRVFQVFEQADESTTKKYGGTGLGLALSRRFTELLGGKLWVESKEGFGSTFYLTLPVRVPPAN